MRNILYFLSILYLGLGAVSCSDDKMDEIGTNPNSPTEVPVKLLMAQVTLSTAFETYGTDLAWYSSVFVEHTTGVHGQLEEGDKRTGINSSIGNNVWNSTYATSLNDLNIIIKQASDGTEAGNWSYVGIAKVLTAMNYSVMTDLWGEVPMKEALQGNSNRTPLFDSQEAVYDSLISLLDSGIADLNKESLGNPGTSDLLYGGDVDLWIKAAYGLKARFYNRQSNIDPEGSADDALLAISSSFEDADDNLVFSKYVSSATGENPWFQELNDRSHHAISTTIFDIMDGFNDPRIGMWFGKVDGEYSPAPNGSALTDQGGDIYSRASSSYLTATSKQELLTFDEIKFIEAEAYLRDNDSPNAYAAYLDAIEAGLVRAGVEQDDIDDYLAQNSIAVGESNLTLEDVITQKYVALWMFQPIEAYNDYRRTRIPTMNNSISLPPERFPYPNDEVSSNPNVPDKGANDKVWWAK